MARLRAIQEPLAPSGSSLAEAASNSLQVRRNLSGNRIRSRLLLRTELRRELLNLCRLGLHVCPRLDQQDRYADVAVRVLARQFAAFVGRFFVGVQRRIVFAHRGRQG